MCCIVLHCSAETDYFVYNRAIVEFAKKAPSARLFTVPDSYHELLQEKEHTRDACRKVICDFFTQKSDSVTHVDPCFPLERFDITTPTYSVPELVGRGVGLVLAAVGVVAGLAMILGSSSAKRK
jgi:hypothetical protein